MQCSGGAGATAYRTGRTTAPHPLLFDYSNLTTHYYTHTPPSHYPHTETPIYLVLLFFSISTLTQATIPAPLRRPLPVVDRPRALRSPWNPSSSFLVTESALSTDCTSHRRIISTLQHSFTQPPTDQRSFNHHAAHRRHLSCLAILPLPANTFIRLPRIQPILSHPPYHRIRAHQHIHFA